MRAGVRWRPLRTRRLNPRVREVLPRHKTVPLATAVFISLQNNVIGCSCVEQPRCWKQGGSDTQRSPLFFLWLAFWCSDPFFKRSKLRTKSDSTEVPKNLLNDSLACDPLGQNTNGQAKHCESAVELFIENLC